MVCSLVEIYFDSPELAIQWKQKQAEMVVEKKGMGIVSPPHFVYDLARKMFLMLYSINWPNFIIYLSLLLEILSNMCIAIVCFPGCEMINFETKFYVSNQSAFLHNQKVKTKILISWERKELLR